MLAETESLWLWADWSELKAGLGPHDVAYMLVSAPSDTRATRDDALLRRYWEGLVAAGVEGYPWEWCQWDYRFSLCTSLFQSVFQTSVYWFRKTATVLEELGCREALHTAHDAWTAREPGGGSPTVRRRLPPGK